MSKDNIEISETPEDSEDTGEETIVYTQPTKKRRIPDLEKDEELTKAIVTFPESTYKKLGELALEKNVSRAAIVRQALKNYFVKIEKPIELNPKATILDKDFNELLEASKGFWGGFETTSEGGFFELFEAKKWKLSDLTPQQYVVLCDCLSVGYKGFMPKPSIEEFLAYAEDLNATEKQLELLQLFLEHNVRWDTSDEKLDTATIEELIAKLKKAIE